MATEPEKPAEVDPPAGDRRSDADREARTVSFSEAFRFWVKLGFISFGGPAGQIAIMHKELVERRRWIGEERFLHALNYCMLLPGPEAQQLAIYIGWLMHRTLGGIVAGAFFVIPSIFILLGLSYVYNAYGHVPAVAGALSGFKPVVVAIVVEAMLKIGSRALRRRAHYVIAALAFVAIYFLHVPFPLIVLAAGLVGLAGVRFWPDTFMPQRRPAAAKAGQRGAEDDGPRPILGDHDPSPPHTLPSRARALRLVATGLALWAVPLVAIALWRGWGSMHAGEYLFFSRAAYVTFGGAYAVLAYVTQATTGPGGWITPAQAVDGLALAETTPGPLIMVLQFIGFTAAWNHPEGMSPATSGAIGALLTTYTTFLPCFFYVFLGGPYIEVLRGNKRVSGALTGVTAAIVGVVLNLAVIFGAAVIWPHGFAGGTNWLALAMSAAAFVALYRLKLDVLWVVLAGGLLGLAATLLLGIGG
jgi:chromate transporter